MATVMESESPIIVETTVKSSVLGRSVGRPRVLSDEQRDFNRKEAGRKWRQLNKEHSKAWDREYNKLDARKEAKKQWYADNKIRVNERKRELYRLKQESLKTLVSAN